MTGIAVLCTQKIFLDISYWTKYKVMCHGVIKLNLSTDANDMGIGHLFPQGVDVVNVFTDPFDV